MLVMMMTTTTTATVVVTTTVAPMTRIICIDNKKDYYHFINKL